MIRRLLKKEAKPDATRFADHIQGDTLNLSHYKGRLHDSDLPDVIALLKQNPSIKIVNLSKNAITDQGVLYFAEHNTTATSVNLSENIIGPQGVLDFAKHNKIVATVNFSKNKLDPVCAREFATHNKFVKDVDFSDNNLGWEGARDFAIHNTAATTVNLSGNKLGPEGALYFAKYNKITTAIDLSRNKLGPEGALHFAQYNKFATTVNLTANQLGPDGARNFVTLNTVTTSLNLCFNDLGPLGAMHFVKHNLIVKKLNLSFNKLGYDGALIFAKDNKAVTSVNLGDNELSSKQALDILNLDSIIKTMYFGSSLDSETLQKFLDSKKLIMLYIDPSNAISADLENRLDEHNERIKEYALCVWGGIYFMKGFIQANPNSQLQCSALPLINTVMTFAGFLHSPPQAKWEHFAATPTFHGFLEEEKNPSPKEVLLSPHTSSLWTKMINKLHKSPSVSPEEIKTHSSSFWRTILQKKDSSAISQTSCLSMTNSAPPLFPELENSPSSTIEPVSKSQQNTSTTPNRFGGKGLGS